jgi:hypothetical protein
MARFATEIPFLLRAGSQEPGATLGPFVDQQLSSAQQFKNKFVSKLKDTNPVFPAKRYGYFQQDSDLTKDPYSKQIIPRTGKDPFAISGQGYLNNFLNNYDRSAVVPPEERVNAQGLSAYVEQPAQAPQKFPGSEGTAVS